MLILIKSSPDTPEGKRGIRMATDLGAGMVLIQNGIYLAKGGALQDLNRPVYLLDEDTRLRGINPEGLGNNLKMINYDGLVNLMMEHEKVIGLF